MANLSSGESSKPQSPQKAFLLGELATTKRSLTQKDEEMRQMEERLHELESAHDRPLRGRRGNQRRDSRSYHQYGSQKEEEEWRLNNFEERRQHVPKFSLPYVKIPSFSGEGDPNIYLGWEAKLNKFLMYMRSKKIKKSS